MDIQQNDRLKFDLPTVLFGASPIGPSVLKVTQKLKVGQCSQQMEE